jgi:putative transposase
MIDWLLRAGRGWGLVVISVPSYAGFRFPAEIISHGVWLYYRFPLSLREVEEMMLQRGVVVSHETVRQWCQKFGQTYANGRCQVGHGGLGSASHG